MAATQIGTADVAFGIIDGTLGYFESLTYESAGETIEITDGCGRIIAAFLTGEVFNVTGTFVLDTTATVPARGATITLAQGSNIYGSIGDIYILGSTEEFSNSEAVKVSFEGKYYPDI